MPLCLCVFLTRHKSVAFEWETPRKHRKVHHTETPRSCASCHHWWCDGDIRPFQHQNQHPRGNSPSLYASPRPGNQPEVQEIQKKSKYSPWSKEIRKKEFLSRTQKNNWLKSIIQSFILIKSLILSVKMQMCYLLHYIWWEEHYSHESRASEYKNYSLMFLDW